jgi:hypothetical protein
MESVVRARRRGTLKSGATVCELVIEGLTAEMGSHDGHGDHISYCGLVACDGREPFVLKSRAYQSDAKGKAVGAKSRRDGKSGEIEQVDEIRISAQTTISLNGIRQNIIHTIDGRRGGNEECIDSIPNWRNRAAETLKFVDALEGFHGGFWGAAGDDPSNDGIGVIRMLSNEIAHGVIAFRNPWSSVKKSGGFEKRVKIHGNDFAALCAKFFHGSMEKVLGFGIAKKLELSGDTKTHHGMASGQLGPRAGPRIARVRGGCYPENRVSVLDGIRKNAHAIERSAGW